jgi:uncharacterized protein YbjT (DUF2867 family)
MILITGASGNVGSAVLKQAVSAGLSVRAAYQSQDKASQAPAGVEPVIMDYGKPASVRTALEGVGKAFLVGPPTRDLPALEANFVEAVRSTGRRQHIVKLSAMGGKDAIFPGLHAESEENIRASGLPYTFLRANGFMQNFVNYNAGTINAQNSFYGSQGDGRVSHIDIRDIAGAAVQVLAGSGHEGQIYNLTGPEALSNAEIAQKFSRRLGRKISYVDLPEAELRRALLSAGMPEWSANALLDLMRLYREGKAATVDPAVEKLTGRKARSFDQFIEDYAFAFQARTEAAS